MEAGLQLGQDAVDLIRADIEMGGHPNPALAGRSDHANVLQAPDDEMVVGGGMPHADYTRAGGGSAFSQYLITFGGDPFGEAISQRLVPNRQAPRRTDFV